VVNSAGGPLKFMSHELRLSSDERLFGMLDYVIGGYYGRDDRQKTFQQGLTIFNGTFGSPLGTGSPAGPSAAGLLSPYTYNPKYSTVTLTSIPSLEIEKSIFANLNLHIGENTEFSAGGRQIWKDLGRGRISMFPNSGLAAIANPNGFGACPAGISAGAGATGSAAVAYNPANPTGGGQVVGSTYAGTCDVVLVAGNGIDTRASVADAPLVLRSRSPFVYSFALSHKFTPDLMAYANYGTAWRAGPGPIAGAPICAAQGTPNPPNRTLCNAFSILNDEKSKSVEIGFKAALFDRRLNVSVAAYRQTFNGYFLRAATAVPYLAGDCTSPNTVNTTCLIQSGVFTYNADVVVKGIDIEANFRLNENFNFGGQFSYSKSRFTAGKNVPCNDGNADGVEDSIVVPTGAGTAAAAAAWINGGGPFGPRLCPISGSATSSPPWTLTLRSEYSHALSGNTRGFIRALWNYYPENPNNPKVIFDDTLNSFVAPKAYSLFNLFLGLRDESGAWEASIAANNLFNNQTILTRDQSAQTLLGAQGQGSAALRFASASSFNSGYRTISYVRPREFQFSLRYAFGSR
jgi:outer membrane receptor protein involved in Fe transport